MSIPAGNGATGASGTGPALGYTLNLFWFNFLFMLISKNNMNTCTYLIHTLSLIYAMKLIVIFGIKIYRKLPSYLTPLTLIFVFLVVRVILIYLPLPPTNYLLVHRYVSSLVIHLIIRAIDVSIFILTGLSSLAMWCSMSPCFPSLRCPLPLRIPAH